MNVMENEKFKVIEEGRLTSSEMKEVCGGYTCAWEVLGLYSVSDNCGKGTTGKYSSCLEMYHSCKDSAFINCGSYGGPTGPDGFYDEFVKAIF